MMRTFKYTVLLTTALLIGGGNSYAVGPDEEAKLVLRHNQIRRNFVNSRAELLNELNQIDNLEGNEKLKKLREFSHKNLNVRQSAIKDGQMRDLFSHYFASELNAIPAVAKLTGDTAINKIREILTNDLDHLANAAPLVNLPEGNFPAGYWHPHPNLHPTTEVQFTHGGGLEYLLNCFDEKELGYALEKGGVGIQVHPYCPEFNNPWAHERPPHYAYRAMAGALDIPVTFTGTIEAQYLMPANHAQEAAIGISDFKHIKNAKLTLVTSDIMKNTLGNAHARHTKEFYKLLPQSLFDRLSAFNVRHHVAPQPTPVTPPSQPAPTVNPPANTKKTSTRQRVAKQKVQRKVTRKAAPRKRVTKQKVARTATKKAARKAVSRQRVAKQKVSRKTTRKVTSRQRVIRKKAAQRR